MCGICGSFTWHHDGDPSLSSAATRAMSELMRRRGPDDEGYWNDGGCSLGFRRLAILDLSPQGHQPMLTAGERHALVFNGELYNFRELRRELEAKGIAFRSSGDTEVVLQSLATWGIAALSRFNGMFALAFYDASTRTLLLARDHAGIKPLYWLRGPAGIVFGSQYDQVISHPWAAGIPVSHEGLGLYLRFGFTSAPYALHEGAHLLEAGAWLTCDEHGHTQTGRFFELPVRGEGSLKGNDAVDAFEAALATSVGRQLVSDVPLGVFLSGGVDSPLVASEAVRLRGAGLKAFTIGVEDPALDESGPAAAFAAALGLDHVLRMIDATWAASILDSVVAACSEPSADFSIFPTMLVSQLAREHVTVALSGDGGDELFWGYPSRFAPAIEQARYFRQPRVARLAHIASRKVSGRGGATRDVLVSSVGAMYQRKHSIILDDDLAALFPVLPPLPAGFRTFECTATDEDEVADWLRWNEYQLHLAEVLMKVDRASMHHSLEVRVPLLDRDVIDVALRTDWRSCLDLERRIGKVPLRAALTRRVGVTSGQKRGFTVPMDAWLAGPLRAVVEERLLSRREMLGLEVRPAHLQSMHQRATRGDARAAWGTWSLLSLVLWEDHHLRAIAPRDAKAARA